MPDRNLFTNIRDKYLRGVVLKMKLTDDRVKQSAVIGLVILGLMGIYVIGAPLLGNLISIGPKEYDLDSFAQRLTEKGAVMYGLGTCSHCNEQKELFGDSFQYINYVECSIEQSVCREKGIEYVPAWEVNGEIVVGKHTLEELSEMYDCPLE